MTTMSVQGKAVGSAALILTANMLVAAICGYVTGASQDQLFAILLYTLPVMLGTTGTGMLLFYRIILPQLHEKDQNLSWQAYHDTLTGLVNRNQLEQSLDMTIASALRNQQKFAIFFLDIDHFKKINDTIGHDAGDEILKIVGERLRNAIRRTDIAARLGGDEFILVIHGADTPDVAATFAEKIINTITTPIKILGHELIISTSIGISFYPADGMNYHSLVKSADLALYKSKQSGRNNYHFCTPAMNDEIREKMIFKSALQTALDRQEFFLVYQPKLDIRKNRISGFEVLLRWQSDTWGDVPPAKIISLTEEMGLISQLGRWIARMAITEAQKWWQGAPSGFSIALNISPRHYMQSGFTDEILEVVHQAKLPGHLLNLEISESLIMQNPDYSLNVTQNLKQHGIQITIDNFGTGFSSIHYLQKFCVDYIKIDRGFVAGLLTDPDQALLLRTIISLARGLNIKILAEGVETEAQYISLIKMGCDEIQGYYIGKPMRAEKIRDFMETRMETASIV